MTLSSWRDGAREIGASDEAEKLIAPSPSLGVCARECERDCVVRSSCRTGVTTVLEGKCYYADG